MVSESNALNLSGKAELALINLALKYELITSIRINWRQSKSEIYIMLDTALNANESHLSEKASELLNALPSKIKSDFKASQGTSAVDRTKKVRMYRGAVVPQSTSSGAKISTDNTIDDTQPKKKRVWRGVSY